MLDEQAIIENKQLQTNFAQEVLEQFINLKVRISVDAIYLDLKRAFGDTTLAVEKFDRSPDSKVCPYLTELIKKVMFYYDLVFQFAKSKILPDEIICKYFPDTPKSWIHGLYDSRAVVNVCLERAERLINELYEILNSSVDLSTLTDVEKITALPKPREIPKSNPNAKRIKAGTTAILLGVFGIHKFSLGYNKEGLIMLGISLFTGGHGARVMMIVGIVEGVIYISKSNKDFDKIYISKKRGWF
jgi:TM2 domain-containing membrane protein YozV